MPTKPHIRFVIKLKKTITSTTKSIIFPQIITANCSFYTIATHNKRESLKLEPHFFQLHLKFCYMFDGKKK